MRENARSTQSLVEQRLQNQRSMRLEWYIIGLIGIEILLSLYQLFGAGLR